MTLLEYLELHNKFAKDPPGEHDGYKGPIPRIICMDGESLSAQASSTSYSSPRNNIGPWEKVEVGFPSFNPEVFWTYAEDKNNLKDSIYGYVPIPLVQIELDLHGGICMELTILARED